jgi:SAM-dependent methyltransferase
MVARVPRPGPIDDRFLRGNAAAAASPGAADAEAYEAWYHSPRGRRIGALEYSLLRSMLRPDADSSLLDVGCGTGHFTRAFAARATGAVVGLDPNLAWLAYARAHSAASYVAGRAELLPFPDKSFDFSICVTALCFVADEERALRELLRVTRRRLVLGLLNRHSLLYLRKGRHGGSGGYAGARWHTAGEIRSLLRRLGVECESARSAALLPGASVLARAAERLWPGGIALGGFLAVSVELEGNLMHD